MMRDFLEKMAHGDLHPQFLPDLTRQAFLICLPDFTLATRKFPKPAQVRFFMPLRYK